MVRFKVEGLKTNSVDIVSEVTKGGENGDGENSIVGRAVKFHFIEGG